MNLSSMSIGVAESLQTPLATAAFAELADKQAALASRPGATGEVVFRALWPLDKLELLKGEIAEMEKGTGSRIEPEGAVAGCSEVIIRVSSPEVRDSEIICAQAGLQALLQLLFAAPPAGQQGCLPSARYLVPKQQVPIVSSILQLAR